MQQSYEDWIEKDREVSHSGVSDFQSLTYGGRTDLES